MRAWYLVLFFVGSVSAATLVEKDFPYYIFNDDGKIRYCMQPESYLSTTTPCWTKGVKTQCKILKVDDGYIDCKENEL